MNDSAFTPYRDLAPLLLRIGIAMVFLVTGYDKLTGIEGTQQFFAGIGIPAAGLMAWVVGIVEFFGGLMVLFGLYIRIPAVLLASVMVVAILLVNMPEGWNAMRLDLMLLLMNVSLFILGSGRYSLDYLLTGRESGVHAQGEPVA